jgi:hypothetical protein
MKTLKQHITEGRQSQRHPLEGHEYHKKSDVELRGIAKDAHEAAEAMKSHNTAAENKYRDQANDSATVRYWRQKNGMPDWYKKKYGHIKEEVEQVVEMDNRSSSGDRREQRANSPEAIARREKEQQDRLRKTSPEMRKKLRLPEPNKGVSEGSEYTPPKLGTVKAHIMNTTTPTVQVEVFKHNTLRGDSYWVTKEMRKFKTMELAKAYVDRIHKQAVSEGAPELLKKEMPLHRHAEKLLAQNGVSKDDPDYHHHLNNTIKHLRQFGNIDLINKQGVAEGLDVDQIDEAAWQRKEGKSESGGLNRKGIESYRRENPGSKLSMAVTTEPSKLEPGSKSANRRKSFCARMGGLKKRLTSTKTANDPDSRVNKALRKWNC